MKEVLESCTVKLGADLTLTLAAKNNLAELYQTQGKYPQAETLFKEALDGCIAELGADHPGILAAKNNLAGLYESQEKYRRGRETV